MTTTSPSRTAPAVRIGLVLGALLALVDLVALVTTEHDGPGGPAVAVAGGLLAVLTLAAVPSGWRGAAWALTTVAVTRLVGALASVPVFFDDDADEPVVVAALTVVLAVAVAVLVLPRRRVQL